MQKKKKKRRKEGEERIVMQRGACEARAAGGGARGRSGTVLCRKVTIKNEKGCVHDDAAKAE